LFFFFQIDRTIRSIDRFDEINFVLGCAECRGVTRLTPTTVESDVTMKMADWDGWGCCYSHIESKEKPESTRETQQSRQTYVLLSDYKQG